MLSASEENVSIYNLKCNHYKFIYMLKKIKLKSFLKTYMKKKSETHPVLNAGHQNFMLYKENILR